MLAPANPGVGVETESGTVENRTSGSVQSVERAFHLLELLADSGDSSLTELSAAIDVPAPTTRRFLKTLVSLGYARQLPNRHYGLGLKLTRLAGRVESQFGPIVTPHLDTLAREIGESANLAVLEGDMVVYIAQSPRGMRCGCSPRSGTARTHIRQGSGRRSSPPCPRTRWPAS